MLKSIILVTRDRRREDYERERSNKSSGLLSNTRGTHILDRGNKDLYFDITSEQGFTLQLEIRAYPAFIVDKLFLRKVFYPSTLPSFREVKVSLHEGSSIRSCKRIYLFSHLSSTLISIVLQR